MDGIRTTRRQADKLYGTEGQKEKIMDKPCKHGDLACGSGYWDCGKCSDEYNRAAYKRLTTEEKAYDDMVDPLGNYHTNYVDPPGCCSCHIGAPCNYCVNSDENG